MPLTVQFATVPDRESWVAEVWDGDWMIAEINREQGDDLTLEVYRPKEGDKLSVPLEEFLPAVAIAKERFGS